MPERQLASDKPQSSVYKPSNFKIQQHMGKSTSLRNYYPSLFTTINSHHFAEPFATIFQQSFLITFLSAWCSLPLFEFDRLTWSNYTRKSLHTNIEGKPFPYSTPVIQVGKYLSIPVFHVTYSETDIFLRYFEL